MTSTGTTLKAAREHLGLNQRQVARQAFGNEDFQSLVSRYEADIVEPSLTNLRKLARALGLSLGDFDRTATTGHRTGTSSGTDLPAN